MRFNIIGAGKLGKNLALALVESGLGQLKNIANKHIASAKSVVNKLGSGSAVPHLHELAPVELTFITSPDDQIGLIAAELAAHKTIIPGSLVVHCSGVLASSELKLLQKQGCLIASLHPLKAFRAGLLDKEMFRGCDIVLEGDKTAVAQLSTLFSKLGARLIPIQVSAKVNYHTAAVIASNYLVTLAATAMELFIDAGIEKPIARQMTENLMTSSLDNIKASATFAEALTGPLARGDLKTIERHLAALNTPAIAALYRAAGIATLPLTTLKPSVKQSLNKLLE